MEKVTSGSLPELIRDSSRILDANDATTKALAVISALTSSEQQATNNPSIDFTYVKAADIGADYVAGSEGQLKEIIEYKDIAKTTISTTTTFKYTDTDFPTKVTNLEVV